MKKKPAARKSSRPAKRKTDGFAPLVAEVRQLIASARHAAARAVSSVQVLTNYEIGRRIVEHEQRGEKRAEYGIELLKTLSEELTAEFGSGFSTTNLKLMRQFFLEYSPRIGQSAPDQLKRPVKGQTASDQFQMQMYVNWYDREVKLPDENPTISILLCKRKKEAIVELTLPPDANIHAREYKLYLPSKELLRQKLLEWTQEAEADG